MERIEASAPGKLVLLGEYAVLFGAPAMVAAIDRRAVVTLAHTPSDRCEVKAPEFAAESALFELAAGGAFEWIDEGYGRRHFSLVESLFEGIASTGELDFGGLPPFSAILDTRAFFETQGGERSKLGLGSSAALSVALVSALEMWAGENGVSDAGIDRLQGMVELHRHMQGGAGSGADVAASFFGGVVRFCLDEGGMVAEASPMSLPEGLRTIFVWTGRSASTGDFLEKLMIRLEGQPEEVQPVLDELGSVSTHGVTAAEDGNAGAFLDTVDAFWRTLDCLGGAIAMPILSEEHRALRRLAKDCGIHYKPSGAGGGDLGVGFTTDEAAVVKMADCAASEGFRVLDLSVDRMGLVRSR